MALVPLILRVECELNAVLSQAVTSFVSALRYVAAKRRFPEDTTSFVQLH